jgi:hypothetical protein
MVEEGRWRRRAAAFIVDCRWLARFGKCVSRRSELTDCLSVDEFASELTDCLSVDEVASELTDYLSVDEFASELTDCLSVEKRGKNIMMAGRRPPRPLLQP